MAEAKILANKFLVDQFSCVICLDLLKDPVTIPCGHSFCMVCITGCWDQEDKKCIDRCPHCKEIFTPRPVLRRNNILSEVVEKLKDTEVPAAFPVSPSPCNPGPEDVVCDFCTGKKHKAIKSCLMCVASFCEDHLDPHYKIPAFKNHELVETTTRLQEKICCQHDEPLKIYCRTDQRCICCLCILDEHKDHDTVSAASERTDKQNELKEEQVKFQQEIQKKQRKVQELKQAVHTVKCCAQAAVEDNEIIFTELISSMEKKCLEVTELIRAQEKAELSRTERLLEKLKQEIADLKRRLTELEELSHTHDHIHFLQSFQFLCDFSGSEDSPNITINQHLSFAGVRKSLSDLKTHLEEFSEQEFNKIPRLAAAFQVISPNDRKDFLKYFCHLTLDSNTVHRKLSLYKENRALKDCFRAQRYPEHPDRFDHYWQVLSKESMYGLCYWEVEWQYGSCVSVSLSYKGISRKGKGKGCKFGHNDQSWSLRCSPFSLSFWHNDIKAELEDTFPTRVGVYVDHNAGTLSFYNVSDTMRLLHRVHTTFTQPVYAGLRVSTLCDMKLCNPE